MLGDVNLKIINAFLFPFSFFLATVAYAGEIDASSPILTQATPANSSEQQMPQRIKPSFSEEERRGFDQKSFRSTFLTDSLNGLSDPLGGGSSGGGGLESNAGLVPLSAEQRGIQPSMQPSFDPTDVIIPRSGIESKGKN